MGAFPAISKTEGDPPFTLTAPSSHGPGAFTYTSSDPTVATISGNTVTIVGAGSSTITATQEAMASFNSSSTSAVLTVAQRLCTAPATRQNGVCTAPPLTGNIVMHGGRTWMPVSFIDTWANANSYCTSTTINGQTGWRLPTEFELSDLFNSGAMNGQGWLLSRTWSATAGTSQGDPATSPKLRKAVRLNDGVITDELEANSGYIACVL